MTVAEEYAARKAGGNASPVKPITDTVLMPVYGITATVQAPMSRQLARAGLLPLNLTTINPENLEDDEYNDKLEAAERAMERLVCENTIIPRIVDHEPRHANQIRYEDVEPVDIAELYKRIMELTQEAYFNAEPATENPAQIKSLTLLAIHARKWGLNPVEVGNMTPAEFSELIMYSELLDAALKKAQADNGQD